MLEEQALHPARHDRAQFACGVAVLEDYLKQFSRQHSRKGVSTVNVLVDTAQPGFILGYYTLSAAQLDIAGLTDADRRKLPRFPVPCFRMGRMACHTDWRGQGLGKALIGCAVDRCMEARKQVGAFALIVDAKDAGAKAFYMHYGFTLCADAPMTLYLPLTG